MAPSGGNTQLTHFVVITNPGVLAKLITLVQEEYGKMEITENTLPYMVNIIKAAAAGTFVFNYNAPALVILTSPRTYGNNFADICPPQNDCSSAAICTPLGGMQYECTCIQVSSWAFRIVLNLCNPDHPSDIGWYSGRSRKSLMFPGLRGPVAGRPQGPSVREE